MTRTVRSRRAEAANQPLYARALRLRHLAPSGLLCFVFLEGALVLGILLALAELVSWWGVLVLPFTVALMVKFNDLVAGALTPRSVATETASARASVLRPAAMPDDPPEAPTTDQTRPARSRPLVTPPPAVVPSLPARTDGPPSVSNRAGDVRVAVTAVPAPAGGGGSWAVSSQAGQTERLGPIDVPAVPAPAVPAPVVPPAYPPSSPSVFTSASAFGEQFRGAGQRAAEQPGGFGPVVSRDPEAAGYGPVATSQAGFPADYTPRPSGNGYSYAGAQGAGHPYEGQSWTSASGGPAPMNPAADGEEARSAGNNAPVRRPWAEQLDVRQQMARQAASRRYE